MIATDYRPGHRCRGEGSAGTSTPRGWSAKAGCLYRCALPPGTEHGTFFAPQAYEIDSAERLDGEVFGPIRSHRCAG